MLTQTGLANGDTGWVANRLDQLGGRWEARARVTTTGTGSPYHAVLLTWPQSNRWPQDGEYDFFEVNAGDKAAAAFIHYPADHVVQDAYTSKPLDLTAWHNYALDWDTKAKALTGYIDGVRWFRTTDPAAQAPGPMHGTIQLDNFFGTSGGQPARLDVDSYRVYAGAQ